MNHNYNSESVILGIAANERKLIKALQQKDTALLESLLHDNLIFMLPTGELINKAMDVENLRSGNATITSIESRDLAVYSTEDNMMSTIIWQLTGIHQGEPFEGNFRYLRVWAMQDGSWKVIGGAGMMVG